MSFVVHEEEDQMERALAQTCNGSKKGNEIC